MTIHAVHLPARWDCVCWSPSCCFLLETPIVGSGLHSLLLLIRVISFIRLFYHWAVTLFFFPVCWLDWWYCMLCCYSPCVVFFGAILFISRGSHHSIMLLLALVVKYRNSFEPVQLTFLSFVWSCSLHPNGRFIVPLWLSATCALYNVWPIYLTLLGYAFTSVCWSDMPWGLPSRCVVCFALGKLI